MDANLLIPPPPPQHPYGWQAPISIQHLYDEIRAREGLCFSHDLIDAAHREGLLDRDGAWCLLYQGEEGIQGVTFTVVSSTAPGVVVYR